MRRGGGRAPAAALAGPFLALEAAGVLVAFASVAGGPAQVLLAGGQALALPYPKGLAGENPEAAALLEADVAAQLDAAGEPEGPVREFLGDPGTLERLQRCMALRHAFGVSGVSFDGVYVPPGEGALGDLAACERARVIIANMVAWRKPVAVAGEGLGLLLGVQKAGGDDPLQEDDGGGGPCSRGCACATSAPRSGAPGTPRPGRAAPPPAAASAWSPRVAGRPGRRPRWRWGRGGPWSGTTRLSGS